MLTPLSPIIYEPVVRRALEEDLGRAGDITSDALIHPQAMARAAVVARKDGRLACLDVALAAFSMVGQGQINITGKANDGEDITAGQELAVLEGPGRLLLTAERTALNLLGHLCGVATTTRLMSSRITNGHTRIVCTRKTTPGLRALEKFAVRAGGGVNHRFGLDDAILIKDNHIAVCGGITEAVQKARSYIGHMVKIEVEVDTLAQLEELLSVGADVVLLDNMSLDDLRRAVSLCRGKIATEASGGISPETVAAVSETGVDYISTGFITHSAPNLDVALDIRDL